MLYRIDIDRMIDSKCLHDTNGDSPYYRINLSDPYLRHKIACRPTTPSRFRRSLRNIVRSRQILGRSGLPTCAAPPKRSRMRISSPGTAGPQTALPAIAVPRRSSWWPPLCRPGSSCPYRRRVQVGETCFSRLYEPRSESWAPLLLRERHY